MRAKNPRIGSSFDDFLKEEGILDEVQAAAMKRVLAAQLEEQMKAQRITKSSLAARMRTSRGAVDRLLDPENTSVTLNTLARVAGALESRLELTLVPPRHVRKHARRRALRTRKAAASAERRAQRA